MSMYFEIVTVEVEAAVGLYEAALGVRFGAPDADLGQARVASRPDGSLIGIRAPLAAHEGPVTRTYLAVADVHAATKAAQASGGMLAYGPTTQGARGTFAILIQGGVQHGLWQRPVG